MNYPVRRWRPALRALAVVLALSLPLPVLAADGNQPAAKPGLKASIARAVTSARLTASPSTTRATTTQSQSVPPTSKSFFKTPAGIAVLAVVGAGTAYALYSTSHDRIHSLVRQ